jgi:hypothetical protein
MTGVFGATRIIRRAHLVRHIDKAFVALRVGKLRLFAWLARHGAFYQDFPLNKR